MVHGKNFPINFILSSVDKFKSHTDFLSFKINNSLFIGINIADYAVYLIISIFASIGFIFIEIIDSELGQSLIGS